MKTIEDLALEVANTINATHIFNDPHLADFATKLIEAWQAQQSQEPVAWAYTINNSHSVFSAEKPPEDAYDEGTLFPLYDAPPPAKIEQEPVGFVDANDDWRWGELRGDVDLKVGQPLFLAPPAIPEGARKVFICTSCEGVYADEPTSRCDCMPEVESYEEGYIVMLKAAQGGKE